MTAQCEYKAVCVFDSFHFLGEIPEELSIDDLKQKAKNGDAKAQTEVLNATKIHLNYTLL